MELDLLSDLKIDLVSGYPLVIRFFLSGSTLASEWHWIGTRLVEWLSIGNQVTQVVVTWLSCSTWHLSCTGLDLDWLGGYPSLIRSLEW